MTLTYRETKWGSSQLLYTYLGVFFLLPGSNACPTSRALIIQPNGTFFFGENDNKILKHSFADTSTA